PLRVSFLQLVEIMVVARFRHLGIKLQRLREAHAYAQDAFLLRYPFASLPLTSAGGRILHDFDVQHPGQLLALDMGGGQYTLPGIVTKGLGNLDYQGTDPWAVRWFPEGKGTPVVIDPHVSGGR